MRTEGMPISAATVVVVNLDPDSLNGIRAALQAEAVLPNASLSFDEAAEVILRTLPDVALVGVDIDSEAAMNLAKVISHEKANTTLVAISLERDADQILAAMRVGYKEYIVLGDDDEQLNDVVRNAVIVEENDDDAGHIVALFGAKGGVGTTLLATHLAAELAAIHRVLAIDLDFNMGDMGPLMDIIPKDTVADLLPRADGLDERRLTTAVHVHPSKVHFLCMPDDLDRLEDFRPDAVQHLIKTAAKGYQYVILDLGTTLDQATVDGMRMADQVLLVTTPDVVGVRDAHRRLKMLGTLDHFDMRHVSVVLNKVPAQPYLTTDTIESNLQIRVMGKVSFDERVVEQAVNEGKLIRDVNHKSQVATEIAQLVGLINSDLEDLQPVEDQAPQSLFARLFNR